MLHHQRQPSPSLLCVQEEEELSSSSFLPVGAVVRADHNEIRSNYSKAARENVSSTRNFWKEGTTH